MGGSGNPVVKETVNSLMLSRLDLNCGWGDGEDKKNILFQLFPFYSMKKLKPRDQEAIKNGLD